MYKKYCVRGIAYILPIRLSNSCRFEILPANLWASYSVIGVTTVLLQRYYSVINVTAVLLPLDNK